MQTTEKNKNQIMFTQKVTLVILFLVTLGTFYFVITATPSSHSDELLLTTAFDMIGMVIALILYTSCCQDVLSQDKVNYYFRILILAVFTALVCDYYGTRFNGIPEYRAVNYLFDYASYISNVAYSFVCWLFYSSILGISKRQKKILRRIFYPCTAIQLGFFVVNVFTPIIFIVDQNGTFIASETEWLIYIFYLIWTIITTYMLVISRQSARIRISIAFYVAIPLLIDLVNIFTLNLSCVIFFASQISMLFLYSNIYIQRGYELEKHKSELASAQLNTMLMQVNPHFIYNTLGAISSLCYLDADVAAEMTNTFARYLRGNLDSMIKDDCISFEKELEQTKLYLRIEQVRFSGIDVYYRIGPKDFQIPSLSIQPLAENAIRHGIRQKLGTKGILEIETREDEDSYIIMVKDNGAGFDPEAGIPEDAHSHLGIENVRKKLELIVGGSLKIESKIGEGTCCTITIPKNQKETEQE